MLQPRWCIVSSLKNHDCFCLWKGAERGGGGHALVRVGVNSSECVTFANLVRVHICKSPEAQLPPTENREAGGVG